jgi:hypothetical protein
MSTDFLSVRPSFLRGMARVVDLCGSLGGGAYDSGEPPAETDARAWLNDWEMVAGDLAIAFEQTAHHVRETLHAAEREG